ncbi:MAG: TIGR02147 family protein [Bdellovibrionota bacterium]
MNGQILFQTALLKNFSQLQAKNPKYSLRAYAKRLQLPPSAVSEILRGRRNVSASKMAEVLGRLHLSPAEMEKILQRPFADSGDQSLTEFRQLSADQYYAIGDWHHFAILSLIETEDFSGDVGEIAKRLGISKLAAAQAVERLKRLGLLSVANKKIKSTGKQISSPDNVANLALQKSQRQNLELATKALEEQSVEERDFLSLTFAMDPDDVPLIKKRFRKFLAQINDEFEGRKKKKVYKTNIQLFTLEKENL